MIRFIKRHPLLTYMLLLSIVKIMLVSNLPILVYTFAAHDDALMVNTALSIMKLDWLGSYSHMTLIKGPFFPFFLAVSKILSLPYQLSSTLFYLLACFVFVYGVKSIFKKRIYTAVLFAVLAFNPITFAIQTFQRVYRNGMAPAQVLIIFGCLLAVYLRREQPMKKLIPWLTVGGFALASMWLTREDGIWIMPFVVVCIVVTAGMLLYQYNKTKDMKYIAKSCLTGLPLVIFGFVLLLVSSINYAYYGIFTTNELNGSNFSKAIHSIYSVEPSEDIDFVSVPRSTINGLYEVSPTLAAIKPEFEAALDGWEIHGKAPGDGQVEDGWFFWCFRDAVVVSGFYSRAVTANEFYLNVHDEIEKAFKEGKLERRFAMPSALMSPWKEGYGGKLLSTSTEGVAYIINFKGTEVLLALSDRQDISGSERFEYITGGTALYADSEMSTSLTSGMNKIVNISNGIATAYQKSGAPLFYIGLIAYAFITAMIILKKKKAIEIWLILTSMLLSILLLVLGVSYIHISAYQGLNAGYLSGAYPLVSAFIFIALLYCIQYILKIIKEMGKKTNGKQINKNV